MTKQRIGLLIGLALSGGCVEDADTAKGTGADAGNSDASTADPGVVLPWTVGNNWTYKVTDKGVSTEKTTTIEAEEVIGGTGPHKDDMAFRVVTLKKDGTDQTVSWQGVVEDGDDEKVVRYREQSFDKADGAVELDTYWDPYKIHIDGTAAHTVAGATWIDAYQETRQTPDGAAPTTTEERDAWAVDQLDATVEVPAGTFEHAIVFTKAGGEDLKTYWYVRGVGKVKETGGQTEELLSYQVTE